MKEESKKRTGAGGEVKAHTEKGEIINWDQQFNPLQPEQRMDFLSEADGSRRAPAEQRGTTQYDQQFNNNRCLTPVPEFQEQNMTYLSK